MQQGMSRRAFLKMAALAGSAMTLAACVAPGAATGDEGAAASAAPVELQWWSFGLGLPPEPYPHGKWEQELADTYMQENPNITIAYQAMGWDALAKMATAVTSGNPPNLILRGGIDQILYALEGDVALEVELPEEFKNDLPDGWYEGMLYQGKNYMVPFYTLAAGMVLNLSIIEEAGAGDLVPTAPERIWS